LSKIAFSPNASGTGTFTVAAPNTNTDYTLTLPTNTGTILTNATAGTVLQVVSASSTTTFSTSSASDVSTGISISITPTKASSRILVSFLGGDADQLAAPRQMFLTIYRGATSLGIGASAANTNYFYSSTRGLSPICVAVADSPNTTSSVTYTLYVRASGAVLINGQSTGVYMFAMEVAV
jgi:hypothetical protein